MESWATFWSAIAALAAGISALLSAIYTRLTYRMVQQSGEPSIVVYSKQNDAGAAIIDIVIANIGHGVATDLVFHLSRPIPQHAFGRTELEGAEPEEMRNGPLINGIPLLAPGESRRITWGQFGGLAQIIGKDYVTVTCTFFHGARRMTSASRLEVHSFTGTDATESSLQAIERDLAQIGKSVGQLSRNAEHIIGQLKRSSQDTPAGKR